jgi:hypothetical protein
MFFFKDFYFFIKGVKDEKVDFKLDTNKVKESEKFC